MKKPGLFSESPATLDRCNARGELRWSVRAETRGELIAGAGGRFWIRNQQGLYCVDAAGNVGSVTLPDDFTLPALDGDPAPMVSLPNGHLLIFAPLSNTEDGSESDASRVEETKGSLFRLATEGDRIASATRVG